MSTIKETDLTNKDIYGTDNTAVQLIEQQYPETAAEFRRLQKQQYEVFCENKWIMARVIYQLELI